MKQTVLLLSMAGLIQTAVAQPTWQQRVDTKIDATLDDKQHIIHAYEEFVYTNNSPDTLKFIYVHLWPNAYKNDRTPFAKQQDLNGNTDFYYAKAKDRGYIDSLQFMVNGKSAEHFSTEDVPDIARIDLPEPLLPGGKITVTTPFKVKLPTVFSRSGHTGQAYYVAQWFPKPAVYDYKGWHPMSYLDQGEFFSEFGSYDVSVTLPQNYVLMATGNCTDEKEVAWLTEKALQPLPSDTLDIYNTPPSAPATKTVHFHEDNIHDFAWFADKRWVVRKDTVVSPGNGQLVTVWAAFMPAYQKNWNKTTQYLKDAVNYYGKWVGPYQYKTIKAVLGDMKAGGGMEYPTITLIDKTSGGSLRTVAIHEAGHNWFQGMLGSNERDHAWMDEGLNTFYEQKTTSALTKDTIRNKLGLNESLAYYQNVATDNDQAIEQTSANFQKINYGLDVYYKTALMLGWLEQYMGADKFENGMKAYFDSWHFHHPYPADLRASLQKQTTKSLSWFFDNMLTTEKKIDYKITDANVTGSTTSITVRNKSGVGGPVQVNAYIGDSLIAASPWSEPFDEKTTLSIPADTWTSLRINDDIPDGGFNNEVFRRKAIFHRFAVKVKPLIGLNLGYKDKIYVAPAWGNNRYDGIMLGLLIHNLSLPENRFRFAVTPMYAFRSKSLVGAASAGYVWYPGNAFKEIMLQTDAKTYHYNEISLNSPSPLAARYMKIAPSLNFIFNEHDKRSVITRQLTLKGYYINEEVFAPMPDTLSGPSFNTEENIYGLIRYRHANERTYNPFNYSIEGHGGAEFAKLNLEGNLRIDYNVKHKSLHIRAYAGKFFSFNDDPAATSRYLLNSSFSGINDYLYDGTYRGRYATNKLAAKQISIQEGGFKIPVFNNVYRSSNWLGSLNLSTDLPLRWLPIRLFFDAGIVPNPTPGRTNASRSTLLYDGGAEVYLFKDVISVYFPVIMSGDFRDYLTNTFGRKNVFARSISFTFQLQNINWLKAPSSLLKTVVK